MRKNGARSDTTQKAIRAAAVSMFSKYGYHAVTLRKLAEQIGMQAGSLYNHIENKQQLLFEILYGIMSDLVTSYEERVKGIDDPVERFDIFIENHLAFHTSRQEEVFIGNMELRNLEPENYAKLIALRDRYQNYLRDLLKAGNDKGVFQVKDVRGTTFALFGMLNSVANWFNPAGPRSSADIIKQYRGLVWTVVAPGSKPPAKRTKPA